MSATVAVALKKVAIYILEYRRWIYWLNVPARSCAFEHGQYGNRAT